MLTGLKNQLYRYCFYIWNIHYYFETALFDIAKKILFAVNLKLSSLNVKSQDVRLTSYTWQDDNTVTFGGTFYDHDDDKKSKFSGTYRENENEIEPFRIE